MSTFPSIKSWKVVGDVLADDTGVKGSVSLMKNHLYIKFLDFHLSRAGRINFVPRSERSLSDSEFATAKTTIRQMWGNEILRWKGEDRK